MQDLNRHWLSFLGEATHILLALSPSDPGMRCSWGFILLELKDVYRRRSMGCSNKEPVNFDKVLAVRGWREIRSKWEAKLLICWKRRLASWPETARRLHCQLELPLVWVEGSQVLMEGWREWIVPFFLAHQVQGMLFGVVAPRIFE